MVIVPLHIYNQLALTTSSSVPDNMWLWRADHAKGAPVTYTSNRCKNGLLVKGDNVQMYGLAVEHAENDLLVWSGNNGETYFYQSELPYGVDQDQYKTFAGYRVDENVTSHKGFGVGVCELRRRPAR